MGRLGDIIWRKLFPRRQAKAESDEGVMFSISGINFRGLTEDDLGDFDGTIRCEYDNERDPYALAVYTDQGKHVGYIPGGNKDLFRRIDARGGRALCEGWIEQGEEDNRTFFYGRVKILW